jgi:RNA polymerase sigma factor (sigma-70 family)
MRKSTDHPILPEEEIRELIHLYQEKGDQQAAERVIAHNERLIYRLAMFYKNTGSCGDQELEDLMQYGRMGMMRALDGFDLNAGTKFITYAYNWVRLYIGRYGKRAGRQVYISDDAKIDQSKVGKSQALFIQRYRRNPTLEELAAITGFPEKKVARLFVRVESLDNGAFEYDADSDDDEDSFIDRLPDPGADTEHDGETAAMVSMIMAKMKKLPKRDQQVLILTFGLEGRRPESLKDVARRMRISTDHVRQIQYSAMLWLREDTLFDLEASPNS